MIEKPIRIQRKRTKGWKMPPNTVYVGRPSKWGNPWGVNDGDEDSPSGGLASLHRVNSAAEAVAMFRQRLMENLMESDESVDILIQLRGKNLACWCQLDQPCHADVLLELANAGETP